MLNTQDFMGWSNHRLNNLRFIISLETKSITTRAAEQQTLTCCDCLKRRLLK